MSAKPRMEIICLGSSCKLCLKAASAVFRSPLTRSVSPLRYSDSAGDSGLTALMESARHRCSPMIEINAMNKPVMRDTAAQLFIMPKNSLPRLSQGRKSRRIHYLVNAQDTSYLIRRVLSRGDPNRVGHHHKDTKGTKKD